MFSLAELTLCCQGISLDVLKDLERESGRALTKEEEELVRRVLAKTAKLIADRSAKQFIKIFL